MYDWKNAKSKVIGYRVNTSVTLKLKDFTKIGPITEQLANAAVSDSQSVSYTLDNIEDAKAKASRRCLPSRSCSAEVLAPAAGRTLETSAMPPSILSTTSGPCHGDGSSHGDESRDERPCAHRAVLASEHDGDRPRERAVYS